MSNTILTMVKQL